MFSNKNRHKIDGSFLVNQEHKPPDNNKGQVESKQRSTRSTKTKEPP